MSEKLGKVLIIGDVIVDVYEDVEIRGICPEALCMDVRPKKYHRAVYLGGAGNIYRQLVKLGTPCMLMTVTGDYSYYLNEQFLPLFNSFNTKEYPILRVIIHDWKLTTKIRYMCHDQQIFRVSDEETEYMGYDYIEPIIIMAENILDGYDVVLLVDYNKGMMIPKLIQQVIKVAKEKNIPVISDVKYNNLDYYDDSLVIKCNKKESSAMNIKPFSKYFIVTNGNKPVDLYSYDKSNDNYIMRYAINAIGNPYFKNANCAGDIFMAGFVNSLVNSIAMDKEDISNAIKAGNELASKSLSKVRDKVV